MKKKKVLWVGHAAMQTGFARVTHGILDQLYPDWDVVVLGIGHRGDPHQYPYKIYPAAIDGDVWGMNRIENVIRQEKPDVVCILMEPWNIMTYVQIMRARMQNNIKMVGYTVVDGENMKPEHATWLSHLDMTIFATEFAKVEAEKAGFTGGWYVIPHGVDPAIYRPCNKEWARRQIGLRNFMPEGAFVVGNVNQNQPRKRLDLTVDAFARWWKNAGKPEDAYLYLHTDVRSEIGWDIGNLAKLNGVSGRVAVTAEDFKIGEDRMRFVYNALDVQITTTSGEGFGLTTLEGMACGIPQIVPEFAALGSWCLPDSVFMVVAPDVSVGTIQQNVVRKTPSPADVALAIDAFYDNPVMREDVGNAGRRQTLTDYFRWSTIAQGFSDALIQATESKGREANLLIQRRGPSGEAAKTAG